MSLRYGLIGAGMMGREHILNLGLLEGCAVTAIADPDEAMRRRALEAAGGGATSFDDHREMLSADLCDAIIIASPNDTHHEILMNVLKTRKPILCEKPLCITSGQCREVIVRASGRRAPVWVAMEYRYMPPIMRLIEELERGRAGHAPMMAIREHRYPFLEKVGGWNRFSERTGGTLVEKCCHFWDLMRVVLKSDPVRVYASAGIDANRSGGEGSGHATDMIDNAFAVVDFGNGTRGMLDLCMFAEGSRWQEFISVTGDRARIDACVPGPARFAPSGGEPPAQIMISDRASKCVTSEEVHVPEEILRAGDHHGATYFQHRRFRDLVLSGEGEPEVGLLDGLWSVLVGEAAEKSARIGQAVGISA